MLHHPPYRTLPLLLLQSFPARQSRQLQFHRLGPFPCEAPLTRHVLASPFAPALRPVEPLEHSARRPQQFVLGGSPGHTVMVLDVARDAEGRRVALLGQGFTPA
ncbi:hypothetical protein D187_008504 [Cystobacter fuscus DSM 2262]|uniref:Uncharacterized protein n=1 Tax=Cystobacter fuscus (strain ATCC 25194 / DSM 2262 / NBRC 100088 / M29) TaxID=1242864 RepID=S9PIS6_CYSF2|nr:hypothetical protein D187_008504 [Cystobacter fuscus DSM 2262]